MHSDFLFFLIFFLSIIQTILGVGVLVLGTPILLILNFSIVEAMNYLLPISIFTSFLNLIIMKYKSRDFFYFFSKLKLFFLICVPSLFIGLLILRSLSNIFNFDFIVAFIIILSLIFKDQIVKILKRLSSTFNKLMFILIGVVHGMTNSGGTLLSIFSINLNDSIEKSRIEITFFYFFLAFFQFIIFCYIFGLDKNFYEYQTIFIQIILGVIFGNLLIKHINKNFFNQMIYFFALISSAFLIFKNLI